MKSKNLNYEAISSDISDNSFITSNCYSYILDVDYDTSAKWTYNLDSYTSTNDNVYTNREDSILKGGSIVGLLDSINKIYFKYQGNNSILAFNSKGWVYPDISKFNLAYFTINNNIYIIGTPFKLNKYLKELKNNFEYYEKSTINDIIRETTLNKLQE